MGFWKNAFQTIEFSLFIYVLFCSCYANAVLQCLTCTKPLMVYLLRRLHSRTCIFSYLFSLCKQHTAILYFLVSKIIYFIILFVIGCVKDWCLMCELEQHVSMLRESGGPLSPNGILSNMRNIGWRMGGGNQEDAHEFLRCVRLISYLHLVVVVNLFFLCCLQKSFSWNNHNTDSSFFFVDLFSNINLDTNCIQAFTNVYASCMPRGPGWWEKCWL